MTTATDLSSSLSGALDQLLTSLRTKAPEPVTIVSAGDSEWFYDLIKKSMVRVPEGTRVMEVSQYPPDANGRIVVQTENNDIIRIDPDQVAEIGFH